MSLYPYHVRTGDVCWYRPYEDQPVIARSTAVRWTYHLLHDARPLPNVQRVAQYPHALIPLTPEELARYQLATLGAEDAL